MRSDNIASFRKVLNLPKNSYLLHAADIISAPNRSQFFKSDKKGMRTHTHASRSLPIASKEDVVVLSAPLNKSYYNWLRSVGLSTDNIYTYNLKSTFKSLAEIIIENPAPVKKLLASLPGKAVYFPFYASKEDKTAAEDVLNIEFYGNEESIALKYFDKSTFKDICVELEIPVVEGNIHKINSTCNLNREELAIIVKSLLKDYQKLIIRGTVGSAGRSLFTTETQHIKKIYKELLKNNDQQVLIEPLLNVISTPNDQWVIDLKGQYRHLSLTAQLFQGLKHAGNISGQYYSKRIKEFIYSISEKIVSQMAQVGYRGVLGIDYIVSEQGIFPIENNARVNGSTYVHALLEQIEKQVGKIECWKFYKARTKPISFNNLKNLISELIYDGRRINSVFPFDCDLLEKTGEMTVIIFAEDVYHIDYLQDILSLKGIIRK